MEIINVGIVKPFSKVVLANKFPIEFKRKTAKKIQRIIEILFFPKNGLIYDTFCKRIKIKNELIQIEEVVKTYISASVFNFPPHVNSYGITFNRINV